MNKFYAKYPSRTGENKDLELSDEREKLTRSRFRLRNIGFGAIPLMGDRSVRGGGGFKLVD